MPDAMNYSDARKNFAATMDKVCEDHEPVIITRRGAKPVVMMSLEDYNSMQETEYLLASPENAKRLMEAMENVRKGNLLERELIDPDAGDED